MTVKDSEIIDKVVNEGTFLSKRNGIKKKWFLHSLVFNEGDVSDFAKQCLAAYTEEIRKKIEARAKENQLSGLVQARTEDEIIIDAILGEEKP